MQTAEQLHPIALIPDEILVVIFDHVYVSLQFDKTHPPRTRPESQWLRLLQVCHRWRDIICTASRFWRVINVYTHPEWLSMCLGRARHSSLDIYVRNAEVLQESLSILHDHKRSIRLLSLNLWPSYVSDLLVAFLGRLANLEVLFLAADKTREAIKTPLFLSVEQFSRLHTLLLSSVLPPNPNISMSITLYSRLRRLEICNCSWDIAFKSFLNLLASCHDLEELSLEYALSQMIDLPGFIDSPTYDVVTLPRLRTFRLEELYHIVPHVLGCIRLPSATLMDVTSNVTDVEDDLLDEAFQPFSGEILPQDCSTLIPYQTEFTAASYIADGDDFMLTASSATRKLVLRLHSDSDCESDIGITTWYASIVAAGLWDAIDVLAECKCTLTSLTLHLDFDELSRNDLRGVLEAFPHLRSLHLSGGGEVENVWRVLGPRAGLPSELYCKNLRTVVFGDEDCRFVGSGALLNRVLATLKGRMLRGLFLERLRMCFMHETEAEYEDLCRRYLPSIRGLVPRVNYRHIPYVNWETD
ncbi:hypothetical protein C8Q76DRAFT_72004 [Earliella scabrosa]|nr:hypothetical protein C8Q76DRAFT_72004 [Earliella scabrosa]